MLPRRAAPAVAEPVGRYPVVRVSSLAQDARNATLARLGAEEFDLLVIGGGITGAGAALDAASRGLKTALVERDDLASGTSSRSSKLVHGGLRYLQQRELRLVMENLAERRRLLYNAPHLVHVQDFLVPLLGRGGVADRTMARTVSAALWAYDLAGGRRIGSFHRRVGLDEALELVEALDRRRLVAGFVYQDGRADDARLTLALARTAAEFGAVIATHAAVEGLRLGPGGAVRGARLRGGLEVRARVVVNAGGVWAGRLAAMDPGSAAPLLRPAKGVHLTFTRERIPCRIAAVVPAGDGRGLFVVPWGERVYVGTTDTDHAGPLDDPVCTIEDVAYVLRGLNAVLREPLTPDDVVASWAGLRPLVADARTTRTADISRRHSVHSSAGGLVTVTGGKLTTYRRMAADAVDAALEQLGPGHQPSRTARLRLRGTGDPAALAAAVRAAVPAVDAATAGHLAGRHGTDAPAVARLAHSAPGLAEPLVAGLPYLRAEALVAVREEWALTLADVLDRRTRARLLDRAATAAAAPAVARLIAPELGWDATRVGAEVDGYLEGLRAEAEAAGVTLELPDAPAGVLAGQRPA